MDDHRLGPTIRTGAAAVLTLAGAWIAGCGSTTGVIGVDAMTSRPAPVLTPAQMAKAHVSSAEEAVRSGDKERALAEFTKAIEVNPNLTVAYMGIGDVYRMDGDWGKAQPQFERAAAIEPNNFQAQFLNGLMLQLMDRVSEAIQAYGRALRIEPNNFKAHLSMSAAYYQLDENAQALVYGRRAVELNPSDGSARFNLGAIYAAMDRHHEAVKEFQQATELMELTPGLLMNLAESLGRLQRYEEMRNTLEQLLKKEESAAGHERMGFALFGLRRYDDALGAFEKSLAINADYTPALNGVGVICMNRWLLSDQKDVAAKDRAVSAWRRSLQVNPSQPKILELLTRYGG